MRMDGTYPAVLRDRSRYPLGAILHFPGFWSPATYACRYRCFTLSLSRYLLSDQKSSMAHGVALMVTKSIP